MKRLTIFSDIGGAITAESIRLELSLVAEDEPITIEINSEGGIVSEACAIYNILRARKGAVFVEVVGWALSAATIVAMAGTRIRMHSNSLLMVHAPWVSTSGNASTLRKSAEVLDQVAASMRTAYTRTGKSAAVIESWLDGEDHWFTAPEALKAGLVDEVIEVVEAARALPVASCPHPIPPDILQRINAMSVSAISNEEQVRAAALRADQERRASIRANFQPHLSTDGVQLLMQQCEDDHTITPEAAGLRLLAHVGRTMQPVASGWVPGAHGASSRMADFKAAAVDVMLQRSGIPVADPHPAAADLARTSVVGLAERVLSMHGKSTASMGRAEVIRAAMTTSDFPELLSNLAGKALRLGYEDTPATHVAWTAEREVSDFKPQTLAMLSAAPALELVQEGGEYKFGAFAESAETFIVRTHGRIVRFTRQALINDDLGALTSIPNTQGAAARRLESDLVYSKLTDNPALSDGKALFHADHGNLPAAASLSIDSLGAARAAMRKQKGLTSSDYIDPQPRFLIVPVTLETAAEALLSSINKSLTTNTQSVEWIRGLTLVADPRLDASSETAWYLSADPRQVEGIVRAYLAGEQRPYLDNKEGWETDTMDYKVRLDIGVGVIDYRGLIKNVGA